jgi:Exopolyphosphatase
MKTLGIIDIGSNSIKLIIVELYKNSSKEIFHKKFQTRLSQFTDNEHHNLSEVGMKKYFSIIYTFKRACDQYDCDEIIAVATESLRRITNSKEIIDTISSSLDVNIRILSAQEECYLGYFSSIPDDLYDYVHIDMGGGSVEIGLVENKILLNVLVFPWVHFQ